LLALIVMVGSFAAGCGADDSLSKEELAEKGKVEKQFRQEEEGGGRGVRSVECRKFSDPESVSLKWDCTATYRLGGSYRCQTEGLNGKDHYGVASCGESQGASYADCLKRHPRAVCRRDARRQIKGCIDVPADRKPCRDSVYGRDWH
jgi:hypothetical protein